MPRVEECSDSTDRAIGRPRRIIATICRHTNWVARQTPSASGDSDGDELSQGRPVAFSVLGALLLVLLNGLACSALQPYATDPVPPEPVRMKQRVDPGPSGHAHNDYLHDQPLFDALSARFRSIEVDVHLRDGELFVAHDAGEIRADRTIKSLYLDPLLELHRAGEAQEGRSGPGFVLSNGKPVILLVDIKTDAIATFEVLRETLQGYADMLTQFGPEQRRERSVSVIVSGNRPRAEIADARPRLAAYDGRLSDLDDTDAMLVPLISDNWGKFFEWTGTGPMPIGEYVRLRGIVDDTRRMGRDLRFWATPDNDGAARTALWDTLTSVGVTLINTDDLSGYREYMLAPR